MANSAKPIPVSVRTLKKDFKLQRTPFPYVLRGASADGMKRFEVGFKTRVAMELWLLQNDFL